MSIKKKNYTFNLNVESLEALRKLAEENTRSLNNMIQWMIDKEVIGDHVCDAWGCPDKATRINGTLRLCEGHYDASLIQKGIKIKEV